MTNTFNMLQIMWHEATNHAFFIKLTRVSNASETEFYMFISLEDK